MAAYFFALFLLVLHCEKVGFYGVAWQAGILYF
jgi:hypothetical protein